MARGGLPIDHDLDAHEVALLEAHETVALLVQDVERHFRRQQEAQHLGLAANPGLLGEPERLQRAGFGRAHRAQALAGGADLRAELLQARPEPLPRELHQPEHADLAELDPRPVDLQGVPETALDRALVAVLRHVDEVDDDEPGQIPEP